MTNSQFFLILGMLWLIKSDQKHDGGWYEYDRIAAGIFFGVGVIFLFLKD